MRKEFSKYIERICANDERFIFLTGDLGFMALENVRNKLGSRFINAGVAEQNMIGIAAGLAQQGFIPIVYSIAPFIVYRCLEQIRNDISFHKMPIIIVGNGGGYGYGIMGPTHHAIEDYGILGSLGITSFIPMLNDDIEKVLDIMVKSGKPLYLRLGYGIINSSEKIPEFNIWRKFSSGDKVTMVSVGPVGINAFYAAKNFSGKIEHWVVGQYPLETIPQALIDSVKITKELICVEEHVKVGGLGENLVRMLMENGCTDFNFKSLAACGYPSATYGSQNFHQKESGLDKDSINQAIKKIVG